jgi:hypothetical protein
MLAASAGLSTTRPRTCTASSVTSPSPISMAHSRNVRSRYRRAGRNP